MGESGCMHTLVVGWLYDPAVPDGFGHRRRAGPSDSSVLLAGAALPSLDERGHTRRERDLALEHRVAALQTSSEHARTFLGL
jgi:hypothetical protein